MEIVTVHAHPKGMFVINRGLSDEVFVDISPETKQQELSGDIQAFKAGGGVVQRWKTDFEKSKESSISKTISISVKARRVLLKNAPIERTMSFAVKSMFAGVIGASRSLDDSQKEALSPISGIGEMGFAFEALWSNHEAEERRLRTIQMFGGTFLASQIVEGLEQRAFDKVSEAENMNDLTNALADIEVAKGLAFCAVALVNAGEPENVITLVAPIIANLETGDIEIAKSGMEALLAGGLGADATQIAHALIAEMSD